VVNSSFVLGSIGCIWKGQTTILMVALVEWSSKVGHIIFNTCFAFCTKSVKFWIESMSLHTNFIEMLGALTMWATAYNFAFHVNK
jgi:hypothetical protein